MRTFASWADPSKGLQPPHESKVNNPLRGAMTDLVAVVRGWRWGRGGAVPLAVVREAPQVRRRMASLAPSEPVVVVAHLERVEDLGALVRSLPSAWRVTRSKLDRALSKGRGALLVADFATAEGRRAATRAVRLARQHEARIVCAVVRRRRSEQDAAVPMAKGPRASREDSVTVRFADAIRPGDPTGEAAILDAIRDLLAEDAFTWWEVLRGEAVDTLSPMAPWRREWQRSAPAKPQSGRTRAPIWR